MSSYNSYLSPCADKVHAGKVAGKDLCDTGCLSLFDGAPPTKPLHQLNMCSIEKAVLPGQSLASLDEIELPSFLI